jgi:hypothetical protein
MTRTISAAFVALSFAVALALPASAVAQTKKRVAIETTQLASALPINGTTADGGTFVGTFDLARFAVKEGQLVALGILNGTLKNAAGVVIGQVRNVAAELGVGAATGSCTILHLELGPLDLDLLGLVVHLNRVVLDITAVPGPGNLLGNLLCAIANLLNTRAPLDILSDALNGLLRVVN